LSFSLVPPSDRSPLFPYTTLFRSPYPQRAVRDGRFKLIHNLVAGYENPGYAYTNGLYPSADSAIAAAPEKIAAAYQRMKRPPELDRKSTRLNSSHVKISYAVFCLK